MSSKTPDLVCGSSRSVLRKLRMSSDQRRSFPPDFVSADTLAYRLDCSRSTIDAYVRQGRLPPPYQIGSLIRWDFAVVRAFIEASLGDTTV